MHGAQGRCAQPRLGRQAGLSECGWSVDFVCSLHARIAQSSPQRTCMSWTSQLAGYAQPYFLGLLFFDLVFLVAAFGAPNRMAWFCLWAIWAVTSSIAGAVGGATPTMPKNS